MSKPSQTTIVVQYPPLNGVGTAGLLLSFIGFFTCGFLCPLGLLLSLIALLQPPRGNALAGVILGLIGSWWLWAFGLVILGGLFVPAAQNVKDAQAKVEAKREVEEKGLPVSETTKEPEPPAQKVAEPAAVIVTPEKEPEPSQPLSLRRSPWNT